MHRLRRRKLFSVAILGVLFLSFSVAHAVTGTTGLSDMGEVPDAKTIEAPNTATVSETGETKTQDTCPCDGLAGATLNSCLQKNPKCLDCPSRTIFMTGGRSVTCSAPYDEKGKEVQKFGRQCRQTHELCDNLRVDPDEENRKYWEGQLKPIQETQRAVWETGKSILSEYVGSKILGGEGFWGGVSGSWFSGSDVGGSSIWNNEPVSPSPSPVQSLDAAYNSNPFFNQTLNEYYKNASFEGPLKFDAPPVLPEGYSAPQISVDGVSGDRAYQELLRFSGSQDVNSAFETNARTDTFTRPADSVAQLFSGNEYEQGFSPAAQEQKPWYARVADRVQSWWNGEIVVETADIAAPSTQQTPVSIPDSVNALFSGNEYEQGFSPVQANTNDTQFYTADLESPPPFTETGNAVSFVKENVTPISQALVSSQKSFTEAAELREQFINARAIEVRQLPDGSTQYVFETEEDRQTFDSLSDKFVATRDAFQKASVAAEGYENLPTQIKVIDSIERVITSSEERLGYLRQEYETKKARLTQAGTDVYSGTLNTETVLQLQELEQTQGLEVKKLESEVKTLKAIQNCLGNCGAANNVANALVSEGKSEIANIARNGLFAESLTFSEAQNKLDSFLAQRDRLLIQRNELTQRMDTNLSSVELQHTRDQLRSVVSRLQTLEYGSIPTAQERLVEANAKLNSFATAVQTGNLDGADPSVQKYVETVVLDQKGPLAPENQFGRMYALRQLATNLHSFATSNNPIVSFSAGVGAAMTDGVLNIFGQTSAERQLAMISAPTREVVAAYVGDVINVASVLPAGKVASGVGSTLSQGILTVERIGLAESAALRSVAQAERTSISGVVSGAALEGRILSAAKLESAAVRNIDNALGVTQLEGQSLRGIRFAQNELDALPQQNSQVVARAAGAENRTSQVVGNTVNTAESQVLSNANRAATRINNTIDPIVPPPATAPNVVPFRQNPVAPALVPEVPVVAPASTQNVFTRAWSNFNNWLYGGADTAAPLVNRIESTINPATVTRNLDGATPSAGPTNVTPVSAVNTPPPVLQTNAQLARNIVDTPPPAAANQNMPLSSRVGNAFDEVPQTSGQNTIRTSQSITREQDALLRLGDEGPIPTERQPQFSNRDVRNTDPLIAAGDEGVIVERTLNQPSVTQNTTQQLTWGQRIRNYFFPDDQSALTTGTQQGAQRTFAADVVNQTDDLARLADDGGRVIENPGTSRFARDVNNRDSFITQGDEGVVSELRVGQNTQINAQAATQQSWLERARAYFTRGAEETPVFDTATNRWKDPTTGRFVETPASARGLEFDASVNRWRNTETGQFVAAPDATPGFFARLGTNTRNTVFGVLGIGATGGFITTATINNPPVTPQTPNINNVTEIIPSGIVSPPPPTQSQQQFLQLPTNVPNPEQRPQTPPAKTPDNPVTTTGPGGTEATTQTPTGGTGNLGALGQILGPLLQRLMGQDQNQQQGTAPNTAVNGTGSLATLKAEPQNITSGGTSMLIWSSIGTKECTVATSGTTTVTLLQGGRDGSVQTPALTETTQFTLSCTTAGTANANAQTTVQVVPAAPGVLFLAKPAALVSGSKTKLSWSTVGTNTCKVSKVEGGEVVGEGGKSGSTGDITLTTTTQFKLECTPEVSGGATKSALITVLVGSTP